MPPPPDLVHDLPENFEKWKKNEDIRIDNSNKREAEHTVTVIVLLRIQSELRTATKKRQPEEKTSRENLRRKFLCIMPTRTLEGK